MDITFIVTGHCMFRYPENSDYMINTLESFKLIENFNDSKVIIALDGNEDPELHERYNIYKNNIKEYIKDKPNYSMICHMNHLNLVKNIYETLKLVKTKYIFLIQQDLPFIESFDLEKVLDDMEHLPQIKHLRFNDVLNIRIKGRNDDNDKFGEKKITRNNTYISTGIFGDRNHISTLKYYNDIVFKDGVFSKPRKWRYLCFGIENIFAYKPMEDQEFYGTYMYGDLNHKAMIKHYRAGRIGDLKLR
jgi:hypothetical protein